MRELLSKRHLSVITRDADGELVRIQDAIANKLLVDGREDLEVALGTLLSFDEPITPKTLDLIGHSTSEESLLLLGNWPINGASSKVTAFFRELAEQDVLARLGIECVRLLGCLTAETVQGRYTICALAEILGVPVYGTTDMIHALHYTRDGFNDEYGQVLVGSNELEQERGGRPLMRGPVHARILDIDALPSSALRGASTRWPLRVADEQQASTLLHLVRRREGATMPGLLSSPMCEIALPSREPGRYHFMQVLLDGQFVRVYPDGTTRDGVLYPIEEPFTLKSLLDTLPDAVARPLRSASR